MIRSAFFFLEFSPYTYIPLPESQQQANHRISVRIPLIFLISTSDMEYIHVRVRPTSKIRTIVVHATRHTHGILVLTFNFDAKLKSLNRKFLVKCMQSTR